jgi:hypothetical protein
LIALIFLCTDVISLEVCSYLPLLFCIFKALGQT